MSVDNGTTESGTFMSTPDSPSAALVAQQPQPVKARVLACVLCQQRKVKCDRKFPCANCVKSRAQCVPANLVPRRRKRRFPERELLARLREYEGLLRQNNIRFDPLHKHPAAETETSHADPDLLIEDEALEGKEADRQSPSTTVRSETVYEAKSFWQVLNQESQGSDHDSDSSQAHPVEAEVKSVWDQTFEKGDPLFGSSKTAVDLSTLHPEPVQIFRLWQIYLDNVNPLLKVTHTPTLQSRLIEAASKMKEIEPALEALMFSIYCMSVLSLSPDDCLTMLGFPQQDLLSRYQFGCQQALSNSGFLRTSNRDCLTAFYLYLVSCRPTTDPRSLCSLLSMAIRIAQRMGLHSEATCAKHTPLEAEMRRRLWWSLVLFEARMGEMADHRTAALTPLWDCKIPLNINDFDLRPDMQELPPVQEQSSEALFVVARSALADFVRHTTFHLDFNYPTLKSIAKELRQSSISDNDQMAQVEKLIYSKYLLSLNMENPLHLITLWFMRGQLAKCRLLEHYAKFSASPSSQTDKERDAAFSHALNMLHSDTLAMSSPRTRGFRWLLHSNFPFPAYVYVIDHLRRRPLTPQASSAWSLMSDNFDARHSGRPWGDSPFFRLFGKMVLQAWRAREVASEESSDRLPTPTIVTSVMQGMAQLNESQSTQSPAAEHHLGSVNEVSLGEFSTSMLADVGPYDSLYGIGEDSLMGIESWGYTALSTQTPMGVNPPDWMPTDWAL